jgi:RNA polymerase sigma-70 factor (ECF subfamily)
LKRDGPRGRAGLPSPHYTAKRVSISGLPAVLTDERSPQVLDGLLERVGAGDRSAFDQLYRLTAARVFGLIRQILRDSAQSEEVGQEVYLEAWQTASRYDRTKGRAQTWLFTMAHRRAIDRVRASQSSRDRDLRIGIRDRETDHDSVAERVEVILESARVRVALAALSAVQRQAIELAYFAGHTQTEIAELLGVPVSTAKTRMRDGLIRLRRELAV